MTDTPEDKLQAGADQLGQLLRCNVAAPVGLDGLVALTRAYVRLAVEVRPDDHLDALRAVGRNVAARIAAHADADGPVARLIVDACRWLAYAVDDYIDRTPAALITLGAAVDEAIGKTRAALTAPAATVVCL